MEHSQFEHDGQDYDGRGMGGMGGMDVMDVMDGMNGMDDMSGHHGQEDDGRGMGGMDGMNGHYPEEGHDPMNNQNSSPDLGVQSGDKGHTCWPHPAKAQEDFGTMQQQLSEATHLHPAAVEHLHILVQEIQEEFEKYQDMHDGENGGDGPNQHGPMHTQCHRLKDAIHQYMILDSENEGAKNLYADFAGAAHGEFHGHEGWDPSYHMRRRPKWTDPLFYDDPDSDDEDGEGEGGDHYGNGKGEGEDAADGGDEDGEGGDHYGNGEGEGEDAADGGDEDGEGGDHYGNGEDEGEFAADGGDNEPQWSGNQGEDTADDRDNGQHRPRNEGEDPADDRDGESQWPGNDGEYNAPGNQPGDGYGDWSQAGGGDDYDSHEPEQSGHHHYGQSHNPGEGEVENDADDRPYQYPAGDHDDGSGYTTGHDPSHVMEQMTATLSLQDVTGAGGGYEGAGPGDQGYGGQDTSESWPPEHDDGHGGPSAHQGYGHHGTHQGGGGCPGYGSPLRVV